MYNVHYTESDSLPTNRQIQRYMSGFCLHMNIWLRNQTYIVASGIRSNRDRLGFYAEIQIFFWDSVPFVIHNCTH